MMSTSIAIREARAGDLAAIRTLLDEYAAWLNLDLSFQDFAREYHDLPGEYGAPGGALLLATADDQPAGMVALRALRGGRCEMKRLYVRPSARGLSLGQRLVERILHEARVRAYREIVLDTLPVMQAAQQLYAAFGFRDVDPYYESPVPGTRFMGLQLQNDATAPF
ncbi:MAG: GNAT family N-acetyltransferase [Vicinamibacterales bacterium]